MSEYPFPTDHQLPGMRTLLEPKTLRQQLKDATGADLDISIAQIRYKPGSSCLVAYNVHGQAGFSQLHAKAFRNEDGNTRILNLARESNVFWKNPQEKTAIFRFPFDSKLPSIKLLMDTPGKFLSRVSYARSPLTATASSIIAYKPHRRLTARVILSSGESVTLKLHDPTTYRRALESARLARKIPEGFRPARIGRSHRYRAIAYRWIDGKELNLADRPMSQVVGLAASLIELLARIHRSMKLDIAKPKKNSLADARRVSRHIGGLSTGLSALAQTVIHQLGDADLTARKPHTIHGDFHSRQIIETSTGLQACDFDKCCLGDSTSDMANFVAHLRLDCLMGQGAPSLVEQVDELASRHFYNIEGTESRRRYQWNLARSLLHLATHPFRAGHQDWKVLTECILNHAAQHAELARRVSSVARAGETNSTPTASVVGVARITHPLSHDRAFEFLADAFDVTRVTEVLHANLSGIETWGDSFEVTTCRLIRHKKGRRCLIEYQLRTRHGTQCVLGKCSARRLDRRSFTMQTQLHDSYGFGRDSSDGIKVPRPLGLYAPWHMWFQEKITARVGHRFLDERQWSELIDQTAAALSKLHSCSLRPSRSHDIQDELQILNERLAKVSEALPRESNRIARITANCRRLSDLLEGRPETAIHRDFYFDQIMFSEQYAYLIDLDLLSTGDPALDVGNFLAHLSELSLRLHGRPDRYLLQERLLEKRYLDRMPNQSSLDIQIFKAISFARHIFLSWSIPERQTNVRNVIRVAEEMSQTPLSAPSTP